MGTINILARRRKDGIVEYGWSGSWHDKNIGQVLVEWYRNDVMVDYLFGLGQVANLSAPLSETCGERSMRYRTCPTGNSYWTADSESEIFSRVSFVDEAYFYDTDGHWYYISVWPLHLKIPLELVVGHLSSIGSTRAYRQQIEKKAAKRILVDWPNTDPEFADLLEQTMSDSTLRSRAWWDGREKKIEAILESKYPLGKIADDWAGLLDYFDNWAIIVPDETYKNAKEILLRRASPDREETICWPGHPLNATEPYVNPYIADYRAGYVTGFLISSIRAWDKFIENVGCVDEEAMAWAREDVAPYCYVPRWFVQKFRMVMDDESAAVDLLNMYMDRLLQKSEFETIYEKGRKYGEDSFHQLMKEGEATWLRRCL